MDVLGIMLLLVRLPQGVLHDMQRLPAPSNTQLVLKAFRHSTSETAFLHNQFFGLPQGDTKRLVKGHQDSASFVHPLAATQDCEAFVFLRNPQTVLPGQTP